MNDEAWQEAERTRRRVNESQATIAFELAGMLKGIIANGDFPAYSRSSADELLARFDGLQREEEQAIAAMVAACKEAA